jgi:hypothetical protein
MIDPLFGLEDIQVQKPIQIYQKIEPDIHYVTTFDENTTLEENMELPWVQALNEEAQIWGSSIWETK